MFVCMEPSSLTEQYKANIKRGAKQDFSQKSNIKNYIIEVPSVCAAP